MSILLDYLQVAVITDIVFICQLLALAVKSLVI